MKILKVPQVQFAPTIVTTIDGKSVSYTRGQRFWLGIGILDTEGEHFDYDFGKITFRVDEYILEGFQVSKIEGDLVYFTVDELRLTI